MSITHFAVYVDDPDRAMRFYQAVFGWRFEAWGPPGYWNISTGGDGPGLTFGALSQRDRPVSPGGPNAWRCTVSVDDVDAALAAIVAHGGTRHSAIADIPGVGRVAEFKDPEGNLACVMAYAPGNPLATKKG